MKSSRVYTGLIFSGTGFLIRAAFIRSASLIWASKSTLAYWVISGGRLYLYWSSSETTLNLESAPSLPSLFLYLLSSESSLDELDRDGEDEHLRYFFFLFFSLLDRCHFFDFFDRLFGEGLLSSSVLLWFEDLLRHLVILLLGCSFRGSPTLGETSLLVRPWSLFDLIREGPFSRSLELLSLFNTMFESCFKTEEAFID